MNTKTLQILLLTVMVSISWKGYAQPLNPNPGMPMSPTRIPYGSIDVRNLPKGKPENIDHKKLQEEYQKNQEERNQLEKQLNQLMVDVGKSKQKIRTATTAFGKWLARREYQQQIESLQEQLNRLDQLEDRQRDIRNMTRDVILQEVGEPGGKGPNRGNNPPGFRPFRREGPGPEGEGPDNRMGPPPMMEFPRNMDTRNMTLAERKEQIKNMIMQMKQRKQQLLDETRLTDERIRMMESQIKAIESGKAIPNNPNPENP